MGDVEKRLQLALAAAGMAVWDATLPGGEVEHATLRLSPEGAALLGLEPRALTLSLDDYLAYIHPDDRHTALVKARCHIERGQDYQLEYRIVTAGGATRWVCSRTHLVAGAGGRVERSLGIVWDVTESKELAQRLEGERELAQVTLSSIGDAVLTTDASGRTRFLNRVGEHLTGWTNARARGRPAAEVLRLEDEGDGAPAEHVIEKCLRTRATVTLSGRSELLARDGRRIAVEDTVAPIWSRTGQLLGTVVVFRDVSHERQLTRQLSWHATHDALTGLVNRREFEQVVARAVSSARQLGHHHALLFLDLDRFKPVNDTCGHGAGDVLLQLLARLLQTHLRESDVLARLGGDELGVLLSHCRQPRALEIAEEIRTAVQDFRFAWDNHIFDIGVSIGLVPIDHDSKPMTELLIDADQACYLAKELGRNRVQIYQESDTMLNRRHGELKWLGRLNQAFERSMFRLFAQPIVALGPNGRSHAEVLIRILGDRGSARGAPLIMPGAFLPAAERYDLMPSIDRWVIKHVCAHLALAPAAAAPPPTLCVNLSGVSLGDPGLLAFITEQFAHYGIDPAALCFELTEAAIIAHLTRAQEFMGTLRARGCRFALDDFGSALSSFAYLKSLPVDYLKIDGVFIRGLADNPVHRAMVNAINEVGHAMGLSTVAEHVEDESTLDAVRRLGIDYAQGYAVGQLAPLDA